MDDLQAVQEQQTTPEEQAIAVQSPAPIAGFWTAGSIKQMLGVAKAISTSDIVPENYKNKPINILVAMEMAGRTNFPLLMVMQNLYVIQGKPSWSGQFCTAVVNGSGRFTPLEFIRLLEDDQTTTKGYYCRATRLSNGQVCEGSPVTWDMVKGEGWLNKSGSKWKTMPDLMFHYRAAAFFVREHCPDLLCGLQTSEEVQDVKGWEKEKETVRIAL